MLNYSLTTIKLEVAQRMGHIEGALLTFKDSQWVLYIIIKWKSTVVCTKDIIRGEFFIRFIHNYNWLWNSLNYDC